MPLTIALSALAQIVWPGALSELALTSFLIALAVALTFVAAARITDSIVAGVAAAFAVMLADPRLYGYPKLIVPVLMLWLVGRWLRRRSSGRLWEIAAGVAVSFLLRHDLGAIAAAAFAVAALAETSHPVSTRVMTVFGAAWRTLLVLAPLPDLRPGHGGYSGACPRRAGVRQGRGAPVPLGTDTTRRRRRRPASGVRPVVGDHHPLLVLVLHRADARGDRPCAAPRGPSGRGLVGGSLGPLGGLPSGRRAAPSRGTLAGRCVAARRGWSRDRFDRRTAGDGVVARVARARHCRRGCCAGGARGDDHQPVVLRQPGRPIRPGWCVEGHRGHGRVGAGADGARRHLAWRMARWPGSPRRRLPVQVRAARRSTAHHVVRTGVFRGGGPAVRLRPLAVLSRGVIVRHVSGPGADAAAAGEGKRPRGARQRERTRTFHVGVAGGLGLPGAELHDPYTLQPGQRDGDRRRHEERHPPA